MLANCPLLPYSIMGANRTDYIMPGDHSDNANITNSFHQICLDYLSNTGRNTDSVAVNIYLNALSIRAIYNFHTRLQPNISHFIHRNCASNSH